jgi:hypothetical protein
VDTGAKQHKLRSIWVYWDRFIVFPDAHVSSEPIFMVVIAPCRICAINEWLGYQLHLVLIYGELVHQVDYPETWTPQSIPKRNAFFLWPHLG